MFIIFFQLQEIREIEFICPHKYIWRKMAFSSVHAHFSFCARSSAEKLASTIFNFVSGGWYITGSIVFMGYMLCSLINSCQKKCSKYPRDFCGARQWRHIYKLRSLVNGHKKILKKRIPTDFGAVKNARKKVSEGLLWISDVTSRCWAAGRWFMQEPIQLQYKVFLKLF